MKVVCNKSYKCVIKVHCKHKDMHEERSDCIIDVDDLPNECSFFRKVTCVYEKDYKNVILEDKLMGD